MIAIGTYASRLGNAFNLARDFARSFCQFQHQCQVQGRSEREIRLFLERNTDYPGQFAQNPLFFETFFFENHFRGREQIGNRKQHKKSNKNEESTSPPSPFPLRVTNYLSPYDPCVGDHWNFISDYSSK
jgi:hypothetical protein